MGHQLGNPRAALAALLERGDGAGVRFGADLRLVFEGVELRRAAAHAEEDDALGAGDELRGARHEVGPGGVRETGEGEVAEAAGGEAKRVAAGEGR